MKRQKNMEKIVLALSFALTTCLLPLQRYFGTENNAGYVQS